MKPVVTALRWVPPFAQGLVRDLRVRWALNEAGQSYTERLIGPPDQASEQYRRLQPFGQVPAYDQGDLTLFESGAIVLQIAERSPVLMPGEAAGRARAKTWMFAALSTVEPPIMFLNQLQQMQVDDGDEVHASVTAAVKSRLACLSEWLDGRDYLEGVFTAGDLLMATVLRILRDSRLLNSFPTLTAYRERCERRPAFQRALADQLAAFRANEPPAP